MDEHETMPADRRQNHIGIPKQTLVWTLVAVVGGNLATGGGAAISAMDTRAVAREASISAKENTILMADKIDRLEKTTAEAMVTIRQMDLAKAEMLVRLTMVERDQEKTKSQLIELGDRLSDRFTVGDTPMSKRR